MWYAAAILWLNRVRSVQLIDSRAFHCDSGSKGASTGSMRTASAEFCMMSSRGPGTAKLPTGQVDDRPRGIGEIMFGVAHRLALSALICF